MRLFDLIGAFCLMLCLSACSFLSMVVSPLVGLSSGSWRLMVRQPRSIFDTRRMGLA